MRNVCLLFTNVGLTGRDLYFPKKSDMLVEGRPSGVIIYNQRLSKSYRLRPEC